MDIDKQDELIHTLYSRWNWFFNLTPEQQDIYNSTRMIPVEETMDLVIKFRFFENFGESQGAGKSLAPEIVESITERKIKKQKEITTLRSELRKTPREKPLSIDQIDKMANSQNRWGRIKKWDELTPEQQAARIKKRVYMNRYTKEKRLKKLLGE